MLPVVSAAHGHTLQEAACDSCNLADLLMGYLGLSLRAASALSASEKGCRHGLLLLPVLLPSAAE